ncbi:hypothetical protein H0H92_001667 [Tricholoma furcatifolium]|nr:hypothetical protein H0H92_001667 [Tricholoma furcatifolium]
MVTTAPTLNTADTANMIIASSDDNAKREQDLPAIPPSDDLDAPPTYTTAPPALNDAAPSGSSLSSAIAPVEQSTLRPTNNVSICRKHGSVKGSWLVDPVLRLPSMLLPPLLPDETEESRRNINLQSSNGEVYADITLAPVDWSVDKKGPKKRTTIYAKASNGSVKLKLHAPKSALRLPFQLKIDASNGSVQIYIPRSFNGLLSLKLSNGSTKFSTQLSNNLTTFSDVDKIHKCFIGDFSTIVEGEEWSGDEIIVEAGNGSLKMWYDDEANQTEGRRPQNFFERLFGISS